MTEPSPKALELSKIFLDSVLGGLDHRINLIKFWGITPGSRVLEIGCGQGDCTTVLADAVGPDGHVDAVDPGAPDYGTYTFPLLTTHSFLPVTTSAIFYFPYSPPFTNPNN